MAVSNLVVVFVLVFSACALVSADHNAGHDSKIGTRLKRSGNEIMIAGKLFDIGTRVILWSDVGGYDAYRVETRFTPWGESSYAKSFANNPDLEDPIRYGMRFTGLTDSEIEQVRGGGWPLNLLKRIVDLFVIHYDAAGYSKRTFQILQDQRDLSVHFMLDVDGTIYQTLDLKEKAYHAGIANTRSIGIEVANIGAYPRDEAPFDKWYDLSNGQVKLKLPNDSWVRHPKRADGRSPRRKELFKGKINGQELYQYDFTPAQYEALSKLTAVLCLVFPKIKCDYPKDNNGEVLPRVFTTDEFAAYHGLLGHWHVSEAKVDPGPAFDWKYLKKTATKYLKMAKKNKKNQKKQNKKNKNK